MPTVPSLALKALEIVSALKQIFYIRNQREVKLLKIQIAVLLRKKLRWLIAIFSNFHCFFLEKYYKVMLHLEVTFQQYQIYWVWQTLWKVMKVGKKGALN